jgi:hypothetical protein
MSRKPQPKKAISYSAYVGHLFRNPLKLLIWAYLMLLIFEGALRKWVLPGLATPLLVVRDPLVLLIYALALQKSMKPFTNGYVLSLSAISGISLMLTMVVGHQNLMVGLFGFRVMVMHFPLIFVIPMVFNKTDVVMVGKAILIISVPMTLLIIAQFYSPQNALVNRLPGGEVGIGLTGALGKFRPPGTFSFITGLVQFYTLAAAFVISAFIERKYFPIIITIGIACCIVVAIPISISRTLFLNVVILGIATVYGITRSKGSAKGLTRLIIFGLIGFAIAMQFDVFKEGMETFAARWAISTEDRGGVEEAIIGRFLGLLLDPLRNVWNVPLLGEGLGLGTIVGAKLTTGDLVFLGGEGEWGRLLVEMGSLLGLTAIIFRTYFMAKLGLVCHKHLSRHNPLPWLIYAATFLLILNGQWGQSTTLGFTVFGAGLCLAAIKIPKKKPTTVPAKRTRAEPPVATAIPEPAPEASVSKPHDTEGEKRSTPNDSPPRKKLSFIPPEPPQPPKPPSPNKNRPLPPPK